MAYLPDESQNPNNPQGPAAGSQANQAPITSSPAPTGGGTAGKTINQASSSAPAQPFTNLQSYLTANAPQIQDQGNKIAGTVSDQYNATTGAIDTAKAGFNDQVNAGYTPLNQQVVNNFSTDPNSVASDPNAASTFKGMYNDKYTGPTAFEGTDQYGTLNNQVQQGQKLASQVSTPAGLQSYLMGNNPNETQGMATLDSSLLGGNPDAVAAVANAAKPYDQLPNYLNNAVTTSDKAIADARTAAQTAQDTTQGAMKTATGNFNDSINAKEAAAIKQAQDYNASVQKAQGDVATDVPLINQLQQIMSQYGARYNDPSATPGAGSMIGNPATPPWADPTKITIPNQVMGLPGAGSVASSSDYATLAALNALSGGTQGNTPIDASTAGQAGTYKAPGAVDRSSLDNAYQSMHDFLTSPQGNNVNVGSQSNLTPFVTAGNDWYNQLLTAFGYHYPGTGPRPAVFQSGTNGPPSGGLGGPGTPGGV